MTHLKGMTMTNRRTELINRLLEGNSGANNLRIEEDLLLDIMRYITPFQFGWANYQNFGSAQSISADTWTNLENDKAGSETQEDYLPEGVKTLMDTDGRFNFETLKLNSIVLFRFDIEITTTNSNVEVEVRTRSGSGSGEFFLGFAGPYQPKSASTYDLAGTGLFYVGSQDVIDNPPRLQLRMGVSGQALNRGTLAAVFNA